MGKKRKKGKTSSKSKINIALILSVLAILISLGQLLISIPTIQKYFEEVNLQVIEMGLVKEATNDIVESKFLINNIGENTAENVRLHLRILQGDRVLFVPDVFDLVKNDLKGGVAKNLYFEADEIVPNELIWVYVFTDLNRYLKTYQLDTLIYNKSFATPKIPYGPKIVSLKHSKGKVKVHYRDSLKLMKLE